MFVGTFYCNETALAESTKLLCLDAKAINESALRRYKACSELKNVS